MQAKAHQSGRSRKLILPLIGGVICILLLIVIASSTRPYNRQNQPRSNAARSNAVRVNHAKIRPSVSVVTAIPSPPTTNRTTKNATVIHTGASKITGTANHKAGVATGDTKWTPAISNMKSAMDNDDHEGALIIARQLMTVADPIARREALDMFRWMGAEALPELTRMLADPSEPLAQLALEGWQNVLGEITDHAGNVRAAVEAITTIQDEAARHALMLQISLLPDDVAAAYYIGMLDAKNNEVVELAREYLTFMAQEPIETKADAQRWVASQQSLNTTK